MLPRATGQCWANTPIDITMYQEILKMYLKSSKRLSTLPRSLSWHADHSFAGLSAASRHKSPVPSNRQRRQLTHLDIAFNCSRHVTAAKCEQPRISRTARTAPRHNLLMIFLLRLKQHHHLWLNTWSLDMWILTRHNFFLRPSRKTSFLNASLNILARPSFLKDVDPALVLTATPAPVTRAHGSGSYSSCDLHH